jgi:hypothetical protein
VAAVPVVIVRILRAVHEIHERCDSLTSLGDFRRMTIHREVVVPRRHPRVDDRNADAAAVVAGRVPKGRTSRRGRVVSVILNETILVDARDSDVLGEPGELIVRQLGDQRPEQADPTSYPTTKLCDLCAGILLARKGQDHT